MGAWFSYNDIRLGQGKVNSKLYLKENPEIALEIENQIRGKYNLPFIEIARLDEIGKMKLHLIGRNGSKLICRILDEFNIICYC